MELKQSIYYCFLCMFTLVFKKGLVVAKPNYIRCDRKLQLGNCINVDVTECEDFVMGVFIQVGASLLEGPLNTCVPPEGQLILSFSQDIAAAHATDGYILGDSKCEQVQGTIKTSELLFDTVEWTAPNTETSVKFMFVRATGYGNSVSVQETSSVLISALCPPTNQSFSVPPTSPPVPTPAPIPTPAPVPTTGQAPTESPSSNTPTSISPTTSPLQTSEPSLDPTLLAVGVIVTGSGLLILGISAFYSLKSSRNKEEILLKAEPRL